MKSRLFPRRPIVPLCVDTRQKSSRSKIVCGSPLFRFIPLLVLLVPATGCSGVPRLTSSQASVGSSLFEPPPGRVKLFVPDVDQPDPSAVSAVTLEQLLAYADEHAPALGVARARSRRGDAGIEAASLLLQNNPQMGLGVGGRAVASSNFFESELSVQQQIEIAGERGLRIQTAEQGREVALAELDEVRWQVHVNVHGLFFEALIAEERVGVAKGVVGFAEDLRLVAQRRVDAGDDAPLAMLVARADLAQAKERLVAADQEERLVRLALAEAAGWPATNAPMPHGALPTIRITRVLPDLIRLAGQHHPALRTLEFAVGEAESRVRLQDREAWPEPTLGFGYGREGDASDPPNVWLFTVGIPIPLWNRNQGQRAQASVALGTARAERESLGLRLQARIARAASAVNAAAERVRIYGADVVPAVMSNLRLIRRAYELGELDIHAVSQTRERVLETQGRAIDARSEYFRALAELEALVGAELDDSALKETRP